MKRKGFTLLELLIAIAILAVLATVAVLVINPAEYLKQSRDAKRIADIGALNKALGLAEFNGLALGGAPTNVYVSLVDTVNTCANLALPPLPATYRYWCVTAAANLKKVDGTGWIPVNLATMVGGSPLVSLPVDPANDVSYFYTYIPGGSFALSAALESDKYLKQSALKDAGTNPAKIEMGSDVKLLTNADGLVGYWPLEEGAGTQVVDLSGNTNTGTGGTIGWASSGCVSGKCITAATGNTVVSVPFSGSTPLDLHTNFTMASWVKINTALPASTWPIILGSYESHKGYGFRAMSSGTGVMFEYATDYPTCGGAAFVGTGGLTMGIGEWHFLVATYDGASIKTYMDGVLKYTVAFNTGMCTLSPMYIGGIPTAPGSFTTDEPRVYARALTATEIKAIYNATK
jgi:prepilin-type N-terminal cleavage/methylation domain-containing protein